MKNERCTANTYISQVVVNKIMHYPNSQINRQTPPPISQCNNCHFYLTERGSNQANRNRSDSIWSVLGNHGSSYCPCFVYKDQRCYSTINNSLQMSDIAETGRKGKEEFVITRSDKEKGDLDKSRNDVKSKQKSVSFSIQGQDKVLENSKTDFKKKTDKQQTNAQNRSQQRQKPKSIPKEQKKLTPEEEEKRHIFLKQCFSIDQYLKSQKAETRAMPNSAIKLFYERPCLQAYGRKNTGGNNGFIYKDYLKTHNVLPHRMGNQPAKYQSYRSSLNFCKRTKIDPEDRWKKIHRQMRKKMDMKLMVQYFAGGAIDVDNETLEDALKLNINKMQGISFERSKSLGNLSKLPASEIYNTEVSTDAKGSKLDFNSTRASNDLKNSSSRDSDRISELKRSKSCGKKQYLFLYRYKDQDGDVEYCKDRHGITCYVDPTFEQNKEAYTKWLKKIKPIQAEDVSSNDRNIDQKLIHNHVIAKQQQEHIPKHYMLPNCDEPEIYRPQKYSFRGRKKLSGEGKIDPVIQ